MVVETLQVITRAVSSIPEGIKHFVDGISLVNLFATLIKLIPDITAVLTLLWMIIRIYETKTVQKLLPCKNKDKDNES